MKTKHLSKNDFTSYINNTLDGAHREIIDAHLLDCQLCRANLLEQQVLQRQISNELNAVLKSTIPPAQMNFTAIVPNLQSQFTSLGYWPQVSAVASTILGLIGLILAMLGVWQIYIVKSIHSPSSQSLGAFPTLACFFLMLASVGQFDHRPVNQFRFFITLASAVILWIGSILIGLLDLIVIRDLAIVTVVTLGGSPSDAAPIAIIAVMIGAIFFIGIIVGGGEYHYRNFGKPNSWKLFMITILGQLMLLILPYLIL